MPGNFIIYSPPWDETSGGAVALHKLCHLLNEAGATARLYPMQQSFLLHPHNLRDLPRLVNEVRTTLATPDYPVNPALRTPMIQPRELARASPNCCVIYPEVVDGNPLRARHVVRWLLHEPGFHTGRIHYETGEFYIRYSEDFSDFRLPGSTTSEHCLTVTHTPVETYLGVTGPGERSGSAYCIRKGKGRPIEHDLADSILIDGKSNAEIAEIFHRVRTFYSYDPNTLYSNLAALCGCDSIVIPVPGLSIAQWRPLPEDRVGIAYGMEDLERARRTRDQVLGRLQQRDRESLEAVKRFIDEVGAHFGLA
jgi:hypothetical protein